LKVGIFGGTFNPIHYGHLRAAEEVKEKLAIDKILFIPSGNPPLKTRDIAEAKHRYEMARLALEDSTLFELSDIECRLPGKSYTIKTVEILNEMNPNSEFFLVLGIDAFLDIPNWRHPEELMKLTNFILISRPGLRFADLKTSPYLKINRKTFLELDRKQTEHYTATLQTGNKAELLNITPIGISSTEIRNLVRRGKSLKYLLPAKVQSYIITNKLYRSTRLDIKSKKLSIGNEETDLNF
jgi:nicotinate-nucleotide adenylyltransferase